MKTTLASLPRQQGIALLLMLLAMACVFGIPAAQAEGVRSADMLAHTCAGCHGDGGRGQDDKSPRLAGQWAPYIRHTLESCRAKGLRCKTRQGAERNPRYVSCPLSNEVLSGERDVAV